MNDSDYKTVESRVWKLCSIGNWKQYVGPSKIKTIVEKHNGINKEQLKS
jgi:hypothetical protein